MEPRLSRCYPAWLEMVPLSLVMLAVIYIAYHYQALPPTIPSHFGASGAPDDWSGKASILVLPVLDILVWLTIAGLNILLLVLPDDPGKYMNISRIQKEMLGQARLEEVRTGIARLMLLLNMLCCGMIAYMTVGQVDTALGQANGMGPWTWAFFIAIIAVSIWMMIYGSRLWSSPEK